MKDRANSSLAQHWLVYTGKARDRHTRCSRMYGVTQLKIIVVSFEFRQIKAAMGAPKQQMLPSFWSDNSTVITGDFKHPILCDFPAGLAYEFSRESPKKNQGCCIVFDYSVATIDCANIYTCIDGELAR